MIFETRFYILVEYVWSAKDWECKSRVKENETKWEKKKMRCECVRQTKRNEPRAYEFFKTKLFRVQQVFFRYLGKSIRSTMVVPRLSIHLDGRRNHDSPGTDLTSTGKQKASGRRYFLVINQGKRGGKWVRLRQSRCFLEQKVEGRKKGRGK